MIRLKNGSGTDCFDGSAALKMSTNDPEDDPPHHCLRPMNDQDDDSRRSDTLVPPTDREADTNPANPIPVPSIERRPHDFFEQAYNKLLEIHEDQKRRDTDIFDEGGRFARMQREHRRELVRELTEAITPRVQRLEDTVAALRRQVDELSTKLVADRTEYERRFSEQQNCLDAINRTLPELEKALRDAEARATQAPTASADNQG